MAPRICHKIGTLMLLLSPLLCIGIRHTPERAFQVRPSSSRSKVKSTYMREQNQFVLIDQGIERLGELVKKKEKRGDPSKISMMDSLADYSRTSSVLMEDSPESEDKDSPGTEEVEESPKPEVKAGPLDGKGPVLLFGQGELDMQLLIAKLAARDGYQSTIYTGGNEKDEALYRRKMYGQEYSASGEDEPGKAQVISAVEALQDALGNAEGLILVCDSMPLRPGAIGRLLLTDSAPNLKRVILMSRIGVTKGKQGLPFGIGGPSDKELLDAETEIRDAVAKAGLELSIVRVGTLKGGGPGYVKNGEVVSGVEKGLSKNYYDTIYELETAMCTMSHDRFTLGAKITAGDPFEMPNPVMKVTTRGSFDPNDADTNRIVASEAIVAALSHPTTLEFTVSSAKGEELPTKEEWTTLLSKAIASSWSLRAYRDRLLVRSDQVIHPQDVTFGGPAGYAASTISVRNPLGIS